MSQQNMNTTAGVNKLVTTLTPLDQSIFYRKIEFAIQSAANDFLLDQFAKNQINIPNLEKLKKSWAHKGYPTVNEFRFDIKTQHTLVYTNKSNCWFPGYRNSADTQVVLADWKSLSRQMSIRTYCNPDGAMKMHSWWAKNILRLLGASRGHMSLYLEADQELRDRFNVRYEAECVRDIRRVLKIRK